MEYREHVSYPGFGWIDPIQDQDCPLVAEETAIAFIEYCESLRQQLAAALAACEAKDAVLNGIKLYRAFNGDDWPSREAITALVTKPDASALRQHDEALIELCAEVCEELKMWPTEKVVADDCAVAIRELKGTL